MIHSKKDLEIILSKLKDLETPKVELEQYTTDSSIAARVVWTAYMRGDVKERIIADLGTGNGILAIACALLMAKKVYAIDIDPEAIKIAIQNYESVKRTYSTSDINFHICDISEFSEKVETVIMNPPFGVRRRHADLPFLEKAFSISNVIYVIHQIESDDFYRKLGKKYDFYVELIDSFNFPLKMTMEFHTKRIHRFKAGLWRFEKKN